MAEKIAQLDELIQMKDSTAENQPTHDEESTNDSEGSNDSATATSKEANAEWHAEFCLFKQQTQEKFEEHTKAIHDLEQLIQDSDKSQQDQTNKFASKTIKVLKNFSETQEKMYRELGKLGTEQKRHGKILDE